MKHVICNSVYSPVPDITSLLPSGDSVELLTGYEPVEKPFFNCVSVHLPYATDWCGVWTGKRPVTSDVRSDAVKYLYYGGSREEIVDNLKTAMDVAAPLKPAYAVMHACSSNFDELFERDYSDDDNDVLSVFCEIMNSVAARYPDGEPPVRLAFENLWWPGLRLIDASCYRYLEKHIEFENWCLCLDTGHLLVATKGADSEKGALEVLNGIVDRYPKDLLDDIVAIHLHVNTSRDVIDGLRSTTPDMYSGGHMERYRRGYSLVTSMDQHRPFTDKGVVQLVERLSPEYVNHEMGAVEIPDRVRDYMVQRSLFS
jgi:hypothetical protein